MAMSHIQSQHIYHGSSLFVNLLIFITIIRNMALTLSLLYARWRSCPSGGSKPPTAQRPALLCAATMSHRHPHSDLVLILGAQEEEAVARSLDSGMLAVRTELKQSKVCGNRHKPCGQRGRGCGQGMSRRDSLNSLTRTTKNKTKAQPLATVEHY